MKRIHIYFAQWNSSCNESENMQNSQLQVIKHSDITFMKNMRRPKVNKAKFRFYFYSPELKITPLPSFTFFKIF